MGTDDGVEPAEQTFADVLNGFSLTGRRSRERHAASEPAPAQPVSRAPVADDVDRVENAAIVRAYAWTGGRTRSDIQLEIETLVSTSDRGAELINTLSAEHQSVARLCHQSKSVAEIAALLSLPLGVARVLLGDMAGLGLVDVHAKRTDGPDDRPDFELLQRVLRGLANLRTEPARPG
jgi:hypothetical protein